MTISRRDHDGPRVLANSIQKTGTHLLIKSLSLFPDLALYHDGVLSLDDHPRLLGGLRRVGGGTFVAAHLKYSDETHRFLEDLDFRTLLMIRDPRDVAIAFYKFALRQRRHPQHRLFTSLPDDQSRLRVSIAGDEQRGEPPRVMLRFDRTLPWLEHGSLAVRFENLVGERGGGDRQMQLAEIDCVARHIGCKLSQHDRLHIADHTFDAKSRTFRKGAIGQWRDEFTQQHKDLFKQVGGRLLIDLGYERDMNR